MVYLFGIAAGHWQVSGVSLPRMAVRRRDRALYQDPLFQRKNTQPGKGQSLVVARGQRGHLCVV